MIVFVGAIEQDVGAHQAISVTDRLPVPASLPMTAIFCPGVTVKYSTAMFGMKVSVAAAAGVPSPIVHAHAAGAGDEAGSRDRDADLIGLRAERGGCRRSAAGGVEGDVLRRAEAGCVSAWLKPFLITA